MRVQYFGVKFEEADSKYFAKDKNINLLTGCGSKQGSILFHCQCSDLAMWGCSIWIIWIQTFPLNYRHNLRVLLSHCCIHHR